MLERFERTTLDDCFYDELCVELFLPPQTRSAYKLRL